MAVTLIRRTRQTIPALLTSVRSPVVRGAFIAVFLTGIGSLVSYPVQIFVSRTLGVAEYGRYAYALSILNIAALIASLDLGHAALRYAGFYFSTGEWPLLRGFLRASRSIVGLTAGVVGGLGALVVFLLRSHIDPPLVSALLVACVLLIPASMIQLELNLLQALKRVYSPRVPNLIARPLAFALALWLATRILGVQATARNALLANTFGVSVAVLLSVYLLRRAWPEEAREGHLRTDIPEWVKFALTTLGGEIFYSILSQQSDVIVVGTMIGTTNAGLYSVASQLSAVVGLGVIAVTHYASPMLAAHQTSKRGPELRRLVMRLVALTCAVSLPLVIILVVWGKLLLRTFGPEFVAAFPVLLIMLGGQTVNAIWGALWGVLLSMLGYQKENFVVVVIVASLNLALTMVLTPRFGIVGAASATVAAVFVRGAIVAWLVHRKLGFWPVSLSLA